MPLGNPSMGHMGIPGSYLEPVMHDAPTAAGYQPAHRSDAHVMHQGPLEPRGPPRHATPLHMPANLMQQRQHPLANGSAAKHEPLELSAPASRGVHASQQAPGAAPAPAQHKKDDSGTGELSTAYTVAHPSGRSDCELWGSSQPPWAQVGAGTAEGQQLYTGKNIGSM